VFDSTLITLTLTLTRNSNRKPNCIPNPYPNTNRNQFKMCMIEHTGSHVYRHFF